MEERIGGGPGLLKMVTARLKKVEVNHGSVTRRTDRGLVHLAAALYINQVFSVLSSSSISYFMPPAQLSSIPTMFR